MRSCAFALHFVCSDDDVSRTTQRQRGHPSNVHPNLPSSVLRRSKDRTRDRDGRRRRSVHDDRDEQAHEKSIPKSGRLKLKHLPNPSQLPTPEEHAATSTGRQAEDRASGAIADIGIGTCGRFSGVSPPRRPPLASEVGAPPPPPLPRTTPRVLNDNAIPPRGAGLPDSQPQTTRTIVQV